MNAEEIADVLWELVSKLPDEAQGVVEDIIDRLGNHIADDNFYAWNADLHRGVK